MSSPATALFLAEWRNKLTRVPRTLARIVFDEPSALTVRVATASVVVGTTVYEAGLTCDPVRARMPRLGTGPEPADCTIRVARRAFAGLGAAAQDALATWKWQGAAVTLYLWNDRRDAAGAQVLAAADALQVFDGVVDSYSVSMGGDVELNLLAPRWWNAPIPPKSIDSSTHPFAPDDMLGVPEPIIYGDHGAFPLRPPAPSAYGFKDEQEDCGGALGVVPMLLVDPGLGAAKVKVLAAGHACVKLFDRTTGYSQFVMGSETPSPLLSAGVTETLGSTGSFIEIADENMVAYAGVGPVEVRASINTALNARRACDVLDETTYATLDQTVPAGILELIMPSVGPLGWIDSVEVLMAYVGNAGNANPVRIQGQVPGGAATAVFTSTLGQSQATTFAVLSATWPTALWNQSWQFGGATGSPIDIKVDFTGGATNKGRVHWIALRVKYRPQRNLISPAVTTVKKVHHYAKSPKWLHRGWDEEVTQLVSEPVYTVDAQFYGHVKGYADTGGGTYTGTGGALIKRPPDMARHLLAEYGGETSFETGSTAFGSFVLARDLLRNAAPDDFNIAAWIGQQTSVQQALQTLCSQALMAVHVDQFTGKWMCHVWKRGAVADYDYVLSRAEIGAMEAGVTTEVDLAQGLRVLWGFDHYRSRPLFETFVNGVGSSQGYAMPTVRDQKLVVDASNNKLDWTYGPSTFNDTLTNGTFSGIELAENVRTRMRTHGPADFHAGHAFTIMAGYNDTVDIMVGAVEYTATLVEGAYDPEAAARELYRALNVALVGSGVSCTALTYTHSNNEFNWTFSGNVTVDVDGSTNRLVGCWHAFGVVLNKGGTTFTSDYPRYSDRIWICHGSDHLALALKFATGANAAATCAPVLGWSPLSDTASGVDHRAPLARSSREAACAASAARYGPRQDRTVEAPWVRDESSAQQLRDRLFDFGAEPTPWVRITTHAMPDLQRMRCVALAPELDALVPFPSYAGGGSWANKVMRVLDVEIDLGPGYHVEFYAEEA